MKKYYDITKYKRYLVPGETLGVWRGGEKENGIMQVPYFDYSPEIAEFMRYFQASAYVNPMYMETMNKRGWFDIKKLQADIPAMTAEDILTCLTGMMRADRFCEGYFLSRIEDGTVHALLEKLDDADETE